MNIEKEVRYQASKEIIDKIISKTSPYKEKQHLMDITFGYDGFNSLSKYGFICRIRYKNDKRVLEVKKKIEEGWLEQEINLSDLGQGINFYKLIGMRPYMFLNRYRETRKFKGLKIFIDEIDIVGDYVEVEFQDSTDAKNELLEFLKLVGIKGPEQDLYGDIIKKRLQTDKEFANKYTSALNDVIQKYIKENKYEIWKCFNRKS